MKIWIVNHYASTMFLDQGGRHYSFAKYLMRMGHDVHIFCANTIHNSDKTIETDGNLFKEIKEDKYDIPFVFVKTPKYTGNGLSRIRNMIFFYFNVMKTMKSLISQNLKPDVILASSVHPLTLVAGLKIGKKFNIKCICEVRDLWPESLVAYGKISKEGLIAKILYQGEKWIYKKANSIIMTWEGGAQYVKDQGWDSEIDLNKIKHISNGVDIEDFDFIDQDKPADDVDIDDKNYINIVYAGSIRNVNNLGMLLDSAQIIQRADQTIRFLVYGSGDEKDALEKRCQEESISNVIFKGRVKKQMIPLILKKSYANILHNSSTSLDQYGQSQNKFFEYLAAGRCIIQTYSTGYSILDRFNCGVSVQKQSPEAIADAVMNICYDIGKTELMGQNAKNVAAEYDFHKLTAKLVEVFEDA